jgi:thiamine biosynthesis lipoprotein
MIKAIWAIALCGGVAASCSSGVPEVRSVTGFAQGTTFSLQWVGASDESEIAMAADRELARIDSLLSNYRPDSEIEAFNAVRTTEPIELSAELVSLLALAKSIHAASAGCFDPTVLPLVRVWGFDTDTPAVPTRSDLEAARALVGLDKLVLDGPTLAHKLEPALAIDMSSIGQGYAADRLAALLEEHGSGAYLAEIGGEIVARGSKPDGSPWRVGVENPAGDEGPGATLRIPPERRTAVITSGTYRHYFEGEGRRLSHVIDPRSGSPIDHGLLSATVVGSEGARTGAWATALLCLGPEQALATAEREGIAAQLWQLDAEGSSSHRETSALASGEWRGVLE